MKKKFLMIAVISLILICAPIFFYGCGGIPSSENYVEEPNNRFIIVKLYANDTRSNYIGFSIVVDKETRVMYLFYKDANQHSGISVMLNADGTPMLWEGEL